MRALVEDHRLVAADQDAVFEVPADGAREHYALQVAAVNVLAQTPTKVPQTEEGVAELRNSVTGVLQQGVINGFLAPGEWNGAVPFGLPAVFKQAIRNLGFYVFSIAVAAQSQTDRAARKAPAIQAAGKTAGAIHSAGIIVNIEP